MPEVVYGDPQRLNQIMAHLVSNAIKFTDQGKVSVRLSSENDQTWSILVQDSGRGISADQQKRIFEPFHQVDSSITRQAAGTGLGLSIVQQLCDLMGASISLESNLDSGSLFTVVIPYNNNSPESGI